MKGNKDKTKYSNFKTARLGIWLQCNYIQLQGLKQRRNMTSPRLNSPRVWTQSCKHYVTDLFIELPKTVKLVLIEYFFPSLITFQKLVVYRFCRLQILLGKQNCQKIWCSFNFVLLEINMIRVKSIRY